MQLSELRDSLALEVLTPIPQGCSVEGGYCGDLLSDVLASAKPNDLWITIQRHINVVAVAKVVGIPAILICKGIRPDAEVLKKAEAEGIAILSSHEAAFEIAGKVYRLLFPEGR